MTYLITEPAPDHRESLSEYQQRGGYTGLARVRAQGGEWAIDQVAAAGLGGRGGTGKGAPVAVKWSKVAHSAHPVRYVVANGAESSTVSQKDRYLLTYFPHRVLEGLLIAAHSVGADQAFLCVRGDSAGALAGAEAALAEAARAGLLGGVSVAVRPTVPTYVSGEETALIDCLEELEGLPQPKPPHPEEAGLRGCPTAVSNVETLAAAAALFRVGIERFRSAGTPDCPGTALFTVAGAVASPGVYEVEYGTPLGALLMRAGAPPPDRILAVLPGGLGSGPLRPDELGVPLTYEALEAVGSSIGPAAPILFSKEGASLPGIVHDAVCFLAGAACGQCQGCTEGHGQLARALAAGDSRQAGSLAMVLLHGQGICAHPSGTARLALRALQAFPASEWHSGKHPPG